MWQASFISRPAVLSELQYSLKVDERVLRHIIIKTDPFRPPPSTHAIKKQAAALLKRLKSEGKDVPDLVQGLLYRRLAYRHERSLGPEATSFED